MTLYASNMEILRKKNEQLAKMIDEAKPLPTERALSGDPIPKINGANLISVYDPKREGEIISSPFKGSKKLVIYGFGFGYHIEPLLGKVKKIVVVEPNLSLIKSALLSRDLKELLRNVDIVTDIDPKDYLSFSLFVHSSSARLNRSHYVKSCGMLKAFLKRFRVVVVYPIYGGSLPIARYCKMALKNLGNEVFPLDFSQFFKAFKKIHDFFDDREKRFRVSLHFKNIFSEMVVHFVEKVRPDICLFLAQAPINTNCLKKIKEMGTKTLYWFVEDFRVMEYFKEIAPFVDIFFTIQDEEFFEELKKIGAKRFYYLPLAAFPRVHRKINLKEPDLKRYGADISFVGAGYYNRRRFFPYLLDLGLKIWGSDWEGAKFLEKAVQNGGRRVSTSESVKIFNATKINLNLHSSTYHNGVNPFGDFVNPRTFEISACCAFQLVDYRKKLPELFKIGDEIFIYRDLKELRELIFYFLERDELREEVSQKARQRVLKEHTYELRMAEMLSFVLFELGTQRKDEIKRFLDTASFDKELLDFLNPYISDKPPTLESLCSAFESKKERFDSKKAIFFLLSTIKRGFI